MLANICGMSVKPLFKFIVSFSGTVMVSGTANAYNLSATFTPLP